MVCVLPNDTVQVKAPVPGGQGPPHRGVMVLIRGDLASKKPITPDTPLSKTRSQKVATSVELKLSLMEGSVLVRRYLYNS
jgi:hypothetical protein